MRWISFSFEAPKFCGFEIADLIANHVKVKGDDLVIRFGDDSLTLRDRDKSDLDATDFFVGL
ncbi:hypothetical protein JJB09_03225 [Rhizobium sp. KVB221]|uniref:Uncharacterized protein n=1 Tax=Rhizobium setariae TaxID=2801340 RepID=A0A937CJE8_9HYPH|nr:hypothetical protein [Rhizobium setariae]MBL0371030.1 hypothetical protein [Rhizobium setariae]